MAAVDSAALQRSPFSTRHHLHHLLCQQKIQVTKKLRKSVRVSRNQLGMAARDVSVPAGDPVRNEKIPRTQQRSAANESIAMQLREAAEKGSSASIVSISNFLKNLSEGSKNPKTNMNAMRQLIETRQTRSDSKSSTISCNEDVVLLRSSDVRWCLILDFCSSMIHISHAQQVTITAAHHRDMNKVTQGRHERCRRSWKSDATVHPFSCMVATSISDIDGIIAEHTHLKRSFDTRRERKRLAGSLEASKNAVAARVITAISFYEKPPVLGEIAQYECAYFKLDPKAFMQDKIEKEGGAWSIVIEVHAIAGDPDLIISCRNKYPSDKDFMWRSMGGGDDKIVITPLDPNYPCNGQGHWQALFIAVPCVGAVVCRFHLLASVSKWTDVASERRRTEAAVSMQARVLLLLLHERV